MSTIHTYGYVRVAAAVPELRVADTIFNTAEIGRRMAEMAKQNVEIALFPELCLTGATCGDLFFQETLLEGAVAGLKELLALSKSYKTVFVVGLPLKSAGNLYNVAAVFQSGNLLGFAAKQPDTDRRWFSAPARGAFVSFSDQFAVVSKNIRFSCEGNRNVSFSVLVGDPLKTLPEFGNEALHLGADLLLCPSACPEILGRSDRVREQARQFSGTLNCGLVLCGAGMNESTTDAVYAGQALLCETGEILAESEPFTFSATCVCTDIDVQRLRYLQKNRQIISPEDWNEGLWDVPEPAKDTLRSYSPSPFIPTEELREKRCKETFQMLSGALARRMKHTGLTRMVVGISGGLDSTLALLIMLDACKLLGWEASAILCLTMPGPGTSDQTYRNALRLIRGVGAELREISIQEACLRHFSDIGHDPAVLDAAYENAQARERTQILMDVANQENGLVVGTGDLSELALGWCTYNGDHMSMYSLNASIAKTFIPYLIRHKADLLEDDALREILYSITATPISPELLPPDAEGNIQQKTEESVGPYRLHDFFLYHFLQTGAAPEKILYLAKRTFHSEYAEEEIRKWLLLFFRRFFSQQFKRSCAPDGPAIGPVSLSPRSGLVMPSDAAAELWLKGLNGNE